MLLTGQNRFIKVSISHPGPMPDDEILLAALALHAFRMTHEGRMGEELDTRSVRQLATLCTVPAASRA